MTDRSQQSVGTFAREHELPRLPVPDLGTSCERFLDWVAPLLDADELARTRSAVESFRAPDGPGPALQARLLEHDATPGRASWADQFFHERYFGRRPPVAINANYFFLFGAREGVGQVERAARLVYAALQFKRLLDTETLPPVTRRGAPVAMDQYQYLFSTTRIPGDPLDTCRSPYTPEWPGPSRERHIAVLRRGHVLSVDVLDEDGNPYAVGELVAGLDAALELSEQALADDEAVAALTSADRVRWARARHELIAAADDEALDTVERALFCVCLDDLAPSDSREACDALLHGDAAARWFDKSVSFIVFADGTAGFNGEHCRLDGTTAIGFLDAVLSAPPPQAVDGDRVPGVRPVRFHTTPAIRREIRSAQRDFADFAADTAGVVLDLDFSAQRAKALGVSPDAFAQMAFQLANHRTTGESRSTYESIAMTGFRLGRTEGLRVVSAQSVEFVRAMDDPAADRVVRRAAFRAAAEQHVRRAGECRDGGAPEQHLAELLRLHRHTGAADPELYDSPGWLRLRDERVSTSAVPSPLVDHWGFGPTGDDCLGIAYALLPDAFRLYLSTRRTREARLTTFAGELPRAVAELETLLRED